MNELTAVSLFAGIGGFDRALERAGVRVVAAVEIDEDCRGVLAHRFPQTRLFSDVREVTGDQLRAAGFVPGRGIITAGWPCQGNSAAGRRRGMDDPRSGLWREVVRLLAETHSRWFLGENVEGLLSVNDGLDFLAVIRGLDELGYGVAWRMLDSQFFGVPQRRHRVFTVGCLGDGALPVEVLLEPESRPGHPAARGEAGQGAAGNAQGGAGGPGAVGAIAGNGPGGGWRVGGGEAAAGQLIPLLEVNGRVSGDPSAGTGVGHDGDPTFTLQAGKQHGIAATLQGGGRRGHRIDAEGAAGGHLIPFDTAQITSAEKRANPRPGDPAPTLNVKGQVHVAETAYALTSRASRASRASREETYVTIPLQDGRGMEKSQNGLGVGAEGDPAYTVDTTGAQSVAIPVDLRNAARDSVAGETAGTGLGADGDPSYTLSATARALPGVATSLAVAGDFSTGEDVAQTVRSANGQPGCDTAGLAVRRLTPLECERLQAFPDDWTRWRLKDGELIEQSDSARYRQVGNAVTVAVPEWIARRLVAADSARGSLAEASGAALPVAGGREEA